MTHGDDDAIALLPCFRRRTPAIARSPLGGCDWCRGPTLLATLIHHHSEAVRTGVEIQKVVVGGV